MSQLFVDNIKNKLGGAVEAPSGIVITGVITATSFVGSGASLTGIDATALADSGGNVKIQANTSGIVVTGVSTFSGNVSVGKTLTYEDVTNVDSVGVITARSGIKIGVGQSISAVSGIVTYYGDGSQLSGVESGVSNFVASGNIANGATVVIKTDGTVGIITQTGSADPSIGSEVVFATAESNRISSVYDSANGKVVIAYQDGGNSNYGTAIVGTVSGTSISFGSEVVFNSGAINEPTSCVYDSTNGKVVIAYVDVSNSNHGTAIVGTVSGTSISFGSKVVYNSGSTDHVTAVYDSTNEKVVIAYSDSDNSSRGTAIVGTVSGTSISFGSEVVFKSDVTTYISSAFDSTNGKVVIAYQGTSEYGTAIVGTVSGTSISFGSEVVFNNSITQYTSTTFDSTNGKVVIAYKDAGNSNYGTSIVGTVNGTSISFGSEVVFNTAITTFISSAFDSTKGKVVIAYRDEGNSDNGTAIVGTVSGTSISFSSELVFNSGNTVYNSCTFDSTNKKTVIAYRDVPNSNYGTAVVLSSNSLSTNLTAENYIGIAAEAISNTATGKINVLGGVNTGQTGLTTAKTYYVQPTGTLATSAGDPSVIAGTSISDTKILIRQ